MNRAADAVSEIIDEFGFLDDWEDRYQLLIDLGRLLPPLPARCGFWYGAADARAILPAPRPP